MPKAAPARKAVCQAVFEEVRAFCVANANEKQAAKWARFFTEGYDAYGVDHKNPAWEENRARWLATLKKAGPTAYLDAGDLLVPGKYEETSFAILFAMGSREAYTPQAFHRIGNWFDRGIRNWGHTDVLSGEVLSAFLQDKVVPLEALEAWRDSANKFQRRAVPVTMVKLVAGPESPSRLLRVIAPMMSRFREGCTARPRLVPARIVEKVSGRNREVFAAS